jgi:hypothetical protein
MKKLKKSAQKANEEQATPEAKRRFYRLNEVKYCHRGPIFAKKPS